MQKFEIQGGNLVYKKLLKEITVPVKDLLWGYLQVEDVKASMCCGGFSTVIGRAIFLDRSGKKHVFQAEGEEAAREVLQMVQKANPGMAVGFTEDNKKRFLKM